MLSSDLEPFPEHAKAGEPLVFYWTLEEFSCVLCSFFVGFVLLFCKFLVVFHVVSNAFSSMVLFSDSF